MKPEKLEIMPFGISISFKINATDYNKKIKKGNRLEIKKIIVALAGPVTNFIIILITANLKIDIIKGITIIYTNLIIMLFNLLPIFPLDGGRILKGILYINFGKRKAEDYINDITIISTIIATALASILILYLKNISIFLIIMYLWYLVLKENDMYKKRKKLYKQIVEINNQNT